VRNHVSNIFDKLGVGSRAQAMVFARDRGFRPSWRGDLLDIGPAGGNTPELDLARTDKIRI